MTERTSIRPRLAPSSAAPAEEIGPALAVAAGVCAALAGARPTGMTVVDPVFSGALALSGVLAATKAAPWTAIPACSVAAVLAGSELSFGLAAFALALAIGGVAAPRAAITPAAMALAVPLLLNLPERGQLGATAAATGVVVAIPVISAVRSTGRARRRRLLWTFVAVVVLAVAGAGVGALAARLAESDLTDGMQDVRAAVDAARAGDQAAAAAALGRAEQSFAAAEASLGAWWAAPARVVPVVGQHLAAARAVTSSGRAIAEAAAEATETADLDQLALRGGRIDLDALLAVREPLSRFADVLDDAVATAEEVDSPWLVRPVADRLADFEAEARDALPDANRAALGVEVAWTLLGGQGPRTYFVAFITPSEGRGLGGFMGNWAEVRAEDGALTLQASGRTEELRPDEGEPPWPLDLPADYRARWGRFDPGFFVQDIPFSPDFPTVANLLAQVEVFARDVEVDGVLAVDPYALAGLLELTGPVQLEEAGVQLTAENAAELLLRDQYATFGGATDERVEFLDEAGAAVFDQLAAVDLPGPRALAEVLGPLVTSGRIRIHTNQATEQAFFAEVGVDGAFPQPGQAVAEGADFLAVTHQNAGRNKIDAYLQVGVAYDATLDRSSGETTATATVRLQNDAPPSGLPPIVIHSFVDDDRPPDGTNRVRLSLYTALEPLAASVDGLPVPIEHDRELGWATATLVVDVPPGATVDVVFELAGSLDLADGYELVVADQPRVAPNRFDLMLTPTDCPSITGSDGLEAIDEVLRASEDLEGPARYVVEWLPNSTSECSRSVVN